jgi:hypothetical protein
MIRKNNLLMVVAALLIAAAALADWRDWINTPDFFSYEYERFDKFVISGSAPFCLLMDSDSELVECHYLSEEHCSNANSVFMRASKPEDRALCVPNPIR